MNVNPKKLLLNFLSISFKFKWTGFSNKTAEQDKNKNNSLGNRNNVSQEKLDWKYNSKTNNFEANRQVVRES